MSTKKEDDANLSRELAPPSNLPVSDMEPVHEKSDSVIALESVACDTNPEASDPIQLKQKSHKNFSTAVKTSTVMLPNGFIDREYCAELRDILDQKLIQEVQINEKSGLRLDVEQMRITGTPLIAGDVQISIAYKINEHRPNDELIFKLFVNPDPKTLWKNIPSETDIFSKDDVFHEHLEAEGKMIDAASQRGRSHAHTGASREDECIIEYNDSDGWVIMAVADGAGSAKYSRRGSEIACKSVRSHCRNFLDERSAKLSSDIVRWHAQQNTQNKKELEDNLYNILCNSAFKAYKEIEKESQKSGSDLKSFATTLLLCVVKKFDLGWFVAGFGIGDGVIGIYDTKSVEILNYPDGGDFAGQTRFLTTPSLFKDSEALFKRIRFDVIKDFTSIILMTDGVSDPKFETDSRLEDPVNWESLWQELSPILKEKSPHYSSSENLLQWLDFWSVGNHDDRTIIIMH